MHLNHTAFAAITRTDATRARRPAVAPASVVIEMHGVIETAENLTYAVVNRKLIASNPRAEDLPLAFAGRLILNPARRYARFNFSGSFASSRRAYTFYKTIDNLYAGLDLGDAPVIRIEDVFTGFDFSLALDLASAIGSLEWRQPGAVPTSPARDSSASALITGARVAATPGASAALAALGLGLPGEPRRPVVGHPSHKSGAA